MTDGIRPCPSLRAYLHLNSQRHAVRATVHCLAVAVPVDDRETHVGGAGRVACGGGTRTASLLVAGRDESVCLN